MPYPWCCPASVVRRSSSVVSCVSSVSTITTRYNEDIESIFGANVHHVSGLCLLGIGGAPYISHKIISQKPNFHIFDFFSETTSRWCFIICRRFPRPRPLSFIKIIVKLHLQAFWQNFEN